MVFIHRHISNLRLDLSICSLYSALVSTEVLHAAAPANWVSADTLYVPKANCERMFLLQSYLMAKKDTHTNPYFKISGLKQCIEPSKFFYLASYPKEREEW